MHEYTPEAAQAIESRQRHFSNRLMVDWNNNGLYDHPLSDMSAFVIRTNRDQAISSTAPDELMLIEGFAAGSLEVEVAGAYEGLPLTGHFAPYNGRSVFYAEGLRLGVSMYYEIGVQTDAGRENFRQFTGMVREVDANRGNGVVALDCLDNVERMRTAVSIPAYAMHTSHLEKGAKRGSLVDSSSVIDLAARTAGFSMGTLAGLPQDPDPKRSAILSVPFHGSMLPEVGMFDNAWEVHRTEDWEQDPNLDYRSEQYRGGPHGYLALNAVPKGQEAFGYKKYWVSEETEAGMYLTGTFVLSCWLYWEGPDRSADSNVIELRNQENFYQLVVEGSNGGVAPRIVDVYGTVFTGDWLFMEPGWNYIEAGFQSHETVIFRTRVNDTETAEREVIGGPLVFHNDVLSGLVKVQNYYAISDVEVLRSDWNYDLHWIHKDITPIGNANISWGRNRVTYTIRDTETPAWELAKDVAAAEYGVVMFDEFGKFNFWTFDDITKKSDNIVRQFSLSDVEGLSMRTTMDSVRNKWVVTTKTGQSNWGIFYDLTTDGQPWWEPGSGPGLDDPAMLRPHSFIIPDTTTFFFFLRAKDNLVCPDPFNVPDLDEFAAWDEHAPYHGKKVYRGDDYAGNAAPYVDPQSAGTEQKWVGNEWVRMSIVNRIDDGGAIGFVLESKDQGRFRVRGTMIYEDQPQTWTVTDPSSRDTYGTRTIELKSNFWLQDRFQTRNMLQSIVSKFGRPIPVTDDITVAGDPRVQIGDVVEVSDPEGMGARIYLQIYGIKREMAAGSGLTDTYSVEVIEPPGQGVWDDEAYGIWDRSFIWS